MGCGRAGWFCSSCSWCVPDSGGLRNLFPGWPAAADGSSTNQTTLLMDLSINPSPAYPTRYSTHTRPRWKRYSPRTR